MFAITCPPKEQLLQSIYTASCVAFVVIALALPNVLHADSEASEHSSEGIVSPLELPSTDSQILEAQSSNNNSPVNDYLDAIDAAALNSGAYSMDLADLYLGLGNSLLNEDEYDRAKLAFQQGMQVERINNGLNSTGQIPYLFSIAEIDKRLGDRKNFKKALNHIYKINAANYTYEDERSLPVLSRLYEEYLNSYRERIVKSDYVSLLSSAKLAGQIVNVFEKNKGLDDPETIESLRAVSQVNYLVAEHLKYYGDGGDSDISNSEFRSNSSLRNDAFRAGMHFRRGKLALSRIIESMDLQEVSSLQYAKAVAELGDWYLIFGLNQSATKTYQVAYQALQDAENAKELQQKFFAKPHPINFVPKLDEELDVSLVKVSMRVSPYGSVRNVKIIDSPRELNISEKKSIKNILNSKRFRPRIVDGKMQATENFHVHYPLENKK